MKTAIIPAVIALTGLSFAAPSPDDNPMLRPEERQAVEAQTNALYDSLTPALTTAAKSTVRIWSGRRLLAYGTVIGKGHQVLTKWSEVARATRPLQVQAADGPSVAATLTGVYEDEDLAVLDLGETTLTPVNWSRSTPRLGAFLAATQPDGKHASFGVVSVLERNLRDADQAYLGVTGAMGFAGPGVKVEEVAADSGAAAAGLQPGNIILKVNQRPISGVLELKNALVGVSPGSKINLLVRDGRKEVTREVVVGNRSGLPNLLGPRLRQMEQMGGPISRVGGSFGAVIQSDMRLLPNQVGGPVVDLQGQIVGITMARADRTRSFIMPATAVEKLLQSPTKDASLAQVRRPAPTELPIAGPDEAPARGPQADPARMRRHMLELQRLMDLMNDELDGLDRPR